MIPCVALVGRPNVGKSSLFNALSGKRISIVSDEAGTTRDRIISQSEWAGREFTIVDTGGIDFDTGNMYSAHIREQVNIAIDLADVIIFLVDGMAGVTPQDTDIANLLRKSKKPIVLAVNKLDSQEREANLYDFYTLKIGEPIAISTTQRRGLGDMLDAVVKHFGVGASGDAFKSCASSASGLTCSFDDGANLLKESPDTTAPLKIAIVGKTNAGKSSISNKLLGEKRSLVSDIAGTTRDCIETPFKWHGREYVLTDTAGVRRKRSVEVQTVEHYSVLRSMAAIRNCDVAVLVIDATAGITEQDVRLAAFIHNDGKPSVIVVNKWDIATDKDDEDGERPVEKSKLFIKWGNDLARDLAFMPYFKAVFTSAQTGQRINEIMVAVNAVTENCARRITTGKLNQLFLDFVAVNPQRAKVKYVTQVGVNPPTFAVFVSKAQFLPPTYDRYLENCLRKSLDFSGTPIKIFIRENEKKGDKA